MIKKRNYEDKCEKNRTSVTTEALPKFEMLVEREKFNKQSTCEEVRFILLLKSRNAKFCLYRETVAQTTEWLRLLRL